MSVVRCMLLTAALCWTSCSDDGVSIRSDKLSSKLHKDPTTHFVTAPLTADVSWQLLGYVDTEEGITVAVAYDLVMNNPSTFTAEVHVSRFTFEDRSGQVVATYEPEEGIADGTIGPRQSAQFTSQAVIDVPTIYDANSIVITVVWATFTEVDTDG